MTISDLSGLPAAAAYLRRIGAEVRSIRTAHVQEREGRYLREIAVIRLDKKDGKVAVSSPSGEDVSHYEPEEAERYAIAIEATAALWPELVLTTVVRNAPPMVQDAKPDDVIEFRGEDGKLIMIQVRRERDDGGKDYIPFTYWSDDKWRMIEPEGDLPLWGIDQLKNADTAFIHEGAKAARAVRRMVEAQTPEAKAALASHPWGDDLKHAAHVGWIGGALSPHRTDWSVLHKAGVKRVITVADNDPPGHAAVPKIARALRTYPITVEAVRFDDRFPSSFDLADSFPETLFSKPPATRRYTGPSLIDCRTPATWATRAITVPPSTGRGQSPSPSYSLRSEFTEQWWMVAGESKPTFLPRRDPTRRYTDVGFNSQMGTVSDHPRPSDLFARQAYASKVDDVTYAPGDAAGVITVNGVRSVNMWVPSRVRPTKGDTGPWEGFMVHLIPSADERGQVMRWLATLTASPSVRMKYGLLLASTAQGVGKTTLCEIMRVLVGERNCSNPTAQQVVESSFNSWIAAKLLIYVNEIYEDKNWTAYNKLKPYVTDPSIRVNEKYMPEYTVPNHGHFILCSNSELALRIEDQDRRFLVPTVTEKKQPPKFWQDFYAWLESGGYGIIAWWAEDFVLRRGAVGPGDHAPMTGRKRQMIDDSRSPSERMVLDLAAAALRQAEDGRQPVILVDADIAAWLPHQPGKGIPAHLIRGWLRGGGLHVTEHSERFTVGGRKVHVAGTISLTGKGWPELKPHRCLPGELGTM